VFFQPIAFFPQKLSGSDREAMLSWLKDVHGLCRAIALEQCTASLLEHEILEAHVLISLQSVAEQSKVH